MAPVQQDVEITREQIEAEAEGRVPEYIQKGR